jgi:hypothetical protein
MARPVRYTFTGGPRDGGWEEDAGGVQPHYRGRILQVLWQGRYLYQSNGPIDGIETEVGLSYEGVKTPNYDWPRVLVECWA